jgi:hypothetical protein
MLQNRLSYYFDYYLYPCYYCVLVVVVIEDEWLVLDALMMVLVLMLQIVVVCHLHHVNDH